MELSPCNASTPKSSVRRRLVQSTLFPNKPQEPDDKPNETDGKDCPREDEQGGEDEDYCASGNKKKRKPKGKVTPRKKSSKNSTPKKNASANGIKGTTSPQMLADSARINTPVPDLRLEAKLSAEENSRIFAGRQVHPFFSSWKLGRTFQEVGESGNSLCTAKREDERITCGPVHVFENIQDNTSSLDWGNWTFSGQTSCVNCCPRSLHSSVFEGSVDFLNFDKLLSALNPSGASTYQNSLSSSDQLSSIQPEKLLEIPSSNSVALANRKTRCSQMTKDAIADLKVGEDCIFSRQAGFFGMSDTEPLSRFLQERLHHQ